MLTLFCLVSVSRDARKEVRASQHLKSLQDYSLGWWMQYYKTGPLGEAHKMQERELALGAYGLAFMPLFLEVLQVYRHHKFHRQLAALNAF